MAEGQLYLIRSCTSLDVIGEPKSFKTHFSNMPRLLVKPGPVYKALITISNDQRLYY